MTNHPYRARTQSEKAATASAARTHGSSMLSTLRTGWSVWLVACLLFSASASAQVLYGTLTGNVTDSSGSAIPGASVTARNVSTGVEREAKSNGEGVYFFNDLNPACTRSGLRRAASRPSSRTR